MKTKTILALLFTATSANAQNSVISHWDFSDGRTHATSLFSTTQLNEINCVTAPAVKSNGLTYSWSTMDSEDMDSQGNGIEFGANCFGGWDAGEFVEFTTHVSPQATSSISGFNFDIANYQASDHNEYRVTLIHTSHSNPSQTYDFGWSSITGTAQQLNAGKWSGSFNKTINLSSLNIGSDHDPVHTHTPDTFRFRIEARGGTNGADSLIVLDNVRVLGHVGCLPEPSSSMLLATAGLAVAFRRKR